MSGPRVALVTGAARGIGAATVLALVEQGMSVVAMDRVADDPHLPYPLGTPAELDALAGPAVRTIVGDVRSETDLARAVAVARELGGLDVVIGGAGVIAGGMPLWEMDDAVVRTVLEIDLYAVLTLARVTIPVLLERPEPREGRFIAVASAAATRGLPMLAAYCAAKAGVTGLVRALSVELRGTGITANAVSPGSTDTPILAESARLYHLPSGQSFAAQQPLDRLLRPEEVAAALAFLASPASSGMTGAIVAVDGGLSV